MVCRKGVKLFDSVIKNSQYKCDFKHKLELIYNKVSMTKKVISIGECMVQMLQRPDGLYSRDYAGDTQNFIQYLAWLGADLDIQAHYLTAMGQDKFGREIVAAWQAHGIETDMVMRTEQKNTGLYFADTDPRGNRDYSYFRSDAAARLMFDLPESEAIFEKALQADVVYSSAITMMILTDENKQKLVDFYRRAKEKGVTTAFDTNYRPAGWETPEQAAKWMDKMFEHTDIVMPTNDENRLVFGDQTDEQTLARMQAAGIPEIVIKCGDKGALVYFDGKTERIESQPDINVVDTTSAGDSFNAAYIAARLSGRTAFEAATWGHRLAAEVIQHRGAFIPKDQLPALAA